MSRDLASERRGTLLWFRRDLRLADHPALRAAIARGGPVWPVFILDPETEAAGGAAPQWRLSRSLAALAQSLDALGSKLILRRGEALETLRDLLRETGAEGVHWSRLYDPASIARDTAVKAALKADGLAAESYCGHLLVEPFAVQTKTGGFFKVYTPFWKAVRSTLAPGAPEPTPARLPVPEKWPASLALDDLRLEQAMNRGGAVVSAFAQVGERAAQDKLTAFLESRVARYGEDRDRPDLDGTSRLSDHLSLGEISPRSVWAATEAAVARHPSAEPSLETYLQEIVWREFGYHLLYHTPHIAERNWRSEWD
ncbi:MAG: deoxyribodipyrimidine photo-lyase, partial [Pseudomonadota bacterium]